MIDIKEIIKFANSDQIQNCNYNCTDANQAFLEAVVLIERWDCICNHIIVSKDTHNILANLGENQNKFLNRLSIIIDDSLDKTIIAFCDWSNVPNFNLKYPLDKDSKISITKFAS
jgi:hypothetical protein